jgi:predicted HTH domain antitoxin
LAPGGRNTNTRELQYIVELDELEHVILETLARIRQRDGAKVANEVRRRLIDGIAAK